MSKPTRGRKSATPPAHAHALPPPSPDTPADTVRRFVAEAKRLRAEQAAYWEQDPWPVTRAEWKRDEPERQRRISAFDDLARRSLTAGRLSELPAAEVERRVNGLREAVVGFLIRLPAAFTNVAELNPADVESSLFVGDWSKLGGLTAAEREEFDKAETDPNRRDHLIELRDRRLNQVAECRRLHFEPGFCRDLEPNATECQHMADLILPADWSAGGPGARPRVDVPAAGSPGRSLVERAKRDPVARFKLNVYEIIRRESRRPKEMLPHLRANKEFVLLVKQAGLTLDKNLIRAARRPADKPPAAG